MTFEEVKKNIEKKIEENENFIRYSYFELRVKYNLSKEEVKIFLEIVQNKLENSNYKIYFEGDEYVFNNEKREVGSDEYLIAIKEEKGK